MRKVLTAAEMREVDRLTTEKYGIPSIILMENAAHAVARVITEKLGGSVKGKSILILCGKGNNGGDGAALSRILANSGANVDAYLFGKVDETSGDARINFEILGRTAFDKLPQHIPYEFWKYNDLKFCETEVGRWNRGYHVTTDYDVVVDSLFGTGLTRKLDDDYAQILEGAWFEDDSALREKIFLTLAVDLPSGLSSDNNTRIGINPFVDVTVTFTAPKIANVMPEASRYNGELVVVDIGSPLELVEDMPSQIFLSEQEDVERWMAASEFSNDSYKNKRGHALLIAGSENYAGAAVLAGNAAMRSGVGLVTLESPKECKTEIASRLLPDVILTGIDTDADEQLTKADAIAVGCGLSATDPAIEKLVRKVVATREVPVIIDAGALWFYSPFEMQQPARNMGNAPLILTPHEGEFLRLLGTDDKEAIKDRVAAVREFSQKHNVILVLKGERVLIGEPGGKVVVNPTGNSGLGKAGNGDTLTGILAGFVAQAAKMNIDIFETIVAAVYIAGMAGDVAEKKYGKRVMTASDVRECLADVFAEFEKQ